MKEIILTEIQILPIKPQKGLVAFASAVLNYQFYIGNIAIHTSPSNPLGFRLVFPTKKLSSGKQLPCFYPFRKDAGEIVTKIIVGEYVMLMNKLGLKTWRHTNNDQEEK